MCSVCVILLIICFICVLLLNYTLSMPFSSLKCHCACATTSSIWLLNALLRFCSDYSYLCALLCELAFSRMRIWFFVVVFFFSFLVNFNALENVDWLMWCMCVRYGMVFLHSVVIDVDFLDDKILFDFNVFNAVFPGKPFRKWSEADYSKRLIR